MSRPASTLSRFAIARSLLLSPLALSLAGPAIAQAARPVAAPQVRLLPAQTARPWTLQPGDLTPQPQPATRPDARQQQRQEQLDRAAPERYDLRRYPPGPATETHWRQTLWATAILEPVREASPQENRPAIAALDGLLALALEPDPGEAQARILDAALQTANQLYLADPERAATLRDRFIAIAEGSPHADWTAIALSALAETEAPERLAGWMAGAQRRLPSAGGPTLQIALQDIRDRLNPPPLPPLADLLRWQVGPEPRAQIYILCRPERGTLCTAVLKDRAGRFVRRGSGPDAPLWSVPLAARSLHHLRWNFIRGQSPQGIYRIEGTMPRPEPREFRAYGQFPLMKLFLPFEAGVERFAPPEPGTVAQPNAYLSLLPPSWRNYFPIQQTYWAGYLGRSLIRIHGSGEPPDFFANHRRYPQSYGWNPAIGCLSALERYDANGQLLEAHMPDILRTFSAAAGGAIDGYAILVEWPEAGGDPTAPIDPAAIAAVLAQSAP